MCRLLTIMSPELSRERAFFDEALVKAGLRSLVGSGLRCLAEDGYKGNPHGTGVGQMLDKTEIFKKGDNAYITTLDVSFTQFMKGRDWTQPLLSHVRSASIGVIGNEAGIWPDEDAQPFDVGNVLMMHNGTVTNHAMIKRNAQIEGAGTDSWVITNLFNAYNQWSLSSWQTVCKQLIGTFALVGVHRAHPHQVWVTRHGRPLFEINIDEGAFIILCTSEAIEGVLLEVTETLFEYTQQAPWTTWTTTELPENRLLMYDTHTGETQNLGTITAKFPPARTYVARGGYTAPKAGNSHPGYKIVDSLIAGLKVIDLEVWELRTLFEKVEETAAGAEFSSSFAVRLEPFFDWLLNKEENMAALREFFEQGTEERIIA